MGRKKDYEIAYTTEPIIRDPKPKKIALLIELFTLAIGVFTAFKVLEINRRLTFLENKLDANNDIDANNKRFSASAMEGFTEDI